MNAQTPDNTLEEEIKSLCGRVERLLKLVEKLSAENNELKQREEVRVQHCEELHARNTKASHQLEHLINQIKHQQHGLKQ